MFVLNVSEDDNVLIGSFVEQESAFREERMEPASRLVDSLRNELSGELSLKEFLVFKGIMILREGHCAGVKPAVKHLGNAVHVLSAFGTFYCYFVDIRAMEFNGFCLFVAAQLIELLSAAYAMTMPAFAFPYRERSTPVTVAGDSPVLNVFKPVAEASFAD